MTAVLVTGATGFIGRAVVDHLVAEGRKVVALTRRPAGAFADGVVTRIAGDIQSLSVADWRPLLRDCSAVVHTAALAHIDAAVDPGVYDAVNHRATATMAEAAEQAGLNRLVFLSSIRAMAGASWRGVIDETSAAAPTDAYGAAKRAAEIAIARSGIDHVILRPVVVVGRGARGNIARLARLAAWPGPLPLAGFQNQRSLVSRETVVRVTAAAIDLPQLSRKSIILADPEPLTPAEMIAAIRRGRGRAAGVFPVPVMALHMAARLAGKGEVWERFAGDAVARSIMQADLPASAIHPVRLALQELGAQR